MSTHPPLHESLSFPRLHARTLRFTLGVPKAVSVVADGSRVLFVRTPSGTDRVGELWAYDVDGDAERRIACPADLLGGDDEQLSAAERSRRERSRESGSGIVSYATDAAGARACFALSGRLWLVDTSDGATSRLPAEGPVVDPRLDPTGTRVAYASGAALHVVGTDGRDARALVEPDGDLVVWGRAEFVAAEEMDRHRGFWWAPDGGSLLVERYDEGPVAVWYLSDPANPDRPPAPQRYPAAGTADADVSLWHVRLDGSRQEVGWDRRAFPYLARVSWTRHGDPLLQVVSRDQRRSLVLAADPATGATRTLRTLTDDAWVEPVPGVPEWSPRRSLVTVEDDRAADTRRVVVDGEPLGPDGLQVRHVAAVDGDGVLVAASEEPTELHLVRLGWDGAVERLTTQPGVHGGVAVAGTTVLTHSGPDTALTRVTVRTAGGERELTSHQEVAGVRPVVRMLHAGARALRTAVLFPGDHVPGSRRLPVLMAPYGGPHALRCVTSARALLDAQWLADQGFCVVVADGRGTPGRGPAWERSVRDRFAEVTLQDQVDALMAVREAHPDDVDTGRTGITGWSYGGYLAALAVLARPDVFGCAVAGAPVTDMRLYDTYYTERYLGHPDEQPEVYEANSLLPLADRLERPLMIIHGLSDDNVVVAHSLRLSSALVAAGRPHTMLPLSGVTHLASQEAVAENLLLLQVRFLREHLAA